MHAQILMERPGDIVVHVKFTVLLLPSGTVKVTGLPFATDAIESDKVCVYLHAYLPALPRPNRFIGRVRPFSHFSLRFDDDAW